MGGRTLLILQLVGLMLVFFIPVATVEAASATVRIHPSELSLGMFYGGGLLHVEGESPSGTDLVVVCIGESTELKLKKKEKVGGILWLNRGEVTFKAVPSFYALSSSRALEELAPQDVLNMLGVGFRALSIQTAEHLPEGQTERLLSELIKLKESEHLFVSNEHGIKIDQVGEDREHWSAVLSLPSKMLAGEYRVNVFGFRDGLGKLIESKTLSVRQVGLAAFVHSLAEQHGLLYGFCAVVIALVVGLLTGMIFGLGSRGGH